MITGNTEDWVRQNNIAPFNYMVMFKILAEFTEVAGTDVVCLSLSDLSVWFFRHHHHQFQYIQVWLHRSDFGSVTLTPFHFHHFYPPANVTKHKHTNIDRYKSHGNPSIRLGMTFMFEEDILQLVHSIGQVGLVLFPQSTHWWADDKWILLLINYPIKSRSQIMYNLFLLSIDFILLSNIQFSGNWQQTSADHQL